MASERLITDNLATWSSAIQGKSAAGRGKSNKLELYGVKKLRELILELAVRGLLVPQDLNDEPADELLKKISAGKAKLVKEGKLKKSKTLPPIREDEKPFDLPQGWAFERLGNLTEKLGSGSTPRGGKNAYVGAGVPFLRSQNIWNDGLKIDDIAYIPDITHEKMSNTKVYSGDVLLNITGASLGRSTVFPAHLREANVSQHVTIIRLIEPAMAQFIHLGILSPMIQRFVWGRQVGMAIEGLSKKVLENFEFPVPPLEEQNRIVAKVGELMALCDQLERRQEASISDHRILVQTLLGALTNASVRDGFDEAWARIASHFDTLFTTVWSIDQLKQTILQLAVMGKLVPQDPDDEPASELLKKIAVEKTKLVKEGKMKKSKALPPIEQGEQPFDLPEGWEWVRPNEISSKITDGEHFKPSITPSGIYFLSAKDIRDEGVSLADPLFVSGETAEKALQRCDPEFGDLLIVSRGATVGRMCKVDISEVFCLLGSVILIKPIRLVLSDYLSIALKSPNSFEQLINASGSTAQQAIYLRDLKKIVLPLPPIEEQQRMIAKVDALMSLCDTLKTYINTAQTTQLQLADALAAPPNVV